MKVKKVIIWLTLVSALLYIGWRMVGTFPAGYSIGSKIAWFILTAVELLGIVELFVHYINLLSMEPKRSVPYVEKWQSVAVLVPSLDEPREVLERTLVACKNMRYKGRFTVWLLDDGRRDWMPEFCREIGVECLQRNYHTGNKAGNLNHAIGITKDPIIAVFDADMAPHEDFLEKTVPWLRGNVAFVQTPQSFVNKDVFSRVWGGDTGEQDFFYRKIQVAKNNSNSVVLSGSNMILSRKALAKVGGFREDTVTEDFATGIELQKANYFGVALDEVLAEGICPQTVSSLMRQRQRWARGCISSGRVTKYKRSGLGFWQKMNYFTGISYWYWGWKNLVYFVMPLLYVFADIMPVRCTWRGVVGFWLPFMVLNGLATYVVSDRQRSIVKDMIYNFTIAPSLLVPVLLEMIGVRAKKFTVTKKTGEQERLSLALPFIVGVALCITAILTSSFKMTNTLTPERSLEYWQQRYDTIIGEMNELERGGIWDERIAKKYQRLVDKKVEIDSKVEQLRWVTEMRDEIGDGEYKDVSAEEMQRRTISMFIDQCLVYIWLGIELFYMCCCAWTIVRSWMLCRRNSTR